MFLLSTVEEIGGGDSWPLGAFSPYFDRRLSGVIDGLVGQPRAGVGDSSSLIGTECILNHFYRK